MITLRWAMLALSTVPIVAALGALQMDLQPSAQRLMVTVGIGLAAPLFWPGAAGTLKSTSLRIAICSSAAACIAAVVLRAIGGTRQPFSRIVVVCAMLLLISIAAYSIATAIELLLRDRSSMAESAREMAGRLTTVLLALIGALPLWLGPLAEILSRTQPWTIDAVVAVSPLTHLAVASGNDLLRNEWLYDRSNLAALPVSYPALPRLWLFYASIALALALIPLARQTLRRRFGHASTACSTAEESI